MEVNVNTDNTIQRHQGLDERVRTQVEEALGRFGDHVRRVDVHLSNENKEKHEDGSNYCMMEALVSGYAPVVVHAHAENLQLSISSAVLFGLGRGSPRLGSLPQIRMAAAAHACRA